MKSIFCIPAIVLISWGIQSPLSWGAQNWTIGPALQKRLDDSVDIVLAGNPLRRTLDNLSKNKKIALLIDHRADPDQKVDISLQQTPLKDALEAIAKKCGLMVTMIGPVAYMAPPETARRTNTLVKLRHEEIRRLSPSAAKNILRQQPIAWDDFSTPRELLERLGKESGIEIDGLDRVPHDLWAAADLPPLGLIERLTLIAGQFDLTFDVSADGKRITLVPVPENIQDRESNTTPRNTIERKPAKSTDNDLSLKRYTLKVVEKPIGPLLKQLAAQMNLEIYIDDKAMEKAGLSLEQRISFSVKDATLDELLRAVLKETRLKFVRQGNVVKIEPLPEQ